MGEADASAEMHQTVHDELQNEIIPAIKSWQKTKYVKSMMSIKPTKDFDEDFKRVSKLFFFVVVSTIHKFLSRHKNHGQNYMLKLINISVIIIRQLKILN